METVSENRDCLKELLTMDLRNYKNKYVNIPKLIGMNYTFSPLTDDVFSLHLFVQKLFNSSYNLELTINSDGKILRIKRINVYVFDNMITNVHHFKGEAETMAEKILNKIASSTAKGSMDPLLEKYNIEAEEAKKAEAVRRSKLIPLPDEKDGAQGILCYVLECIKKKQNPEIINTEFILAFRKARKTSIDTDTYIQNFLDSLANYGNPDSTWFCYADFVTDFAVRSNNIDLYREYLSKIKKIAEENTAESFTYASQAKYNILCTLSNV